MANRDQFIQSYRGAFRQSEKGARGIAKPWIWVSDDNGAEIVNPDGSTYRYTSPGSLVPLAIRPDVFVRSRQTSEGNGVALYPHLRHGNNPTPEWSYLGSGTPDHRRGVAFDSNRDVIMVGYFVYAPGGEDDQYEVVKLSGEDGSLLWRIVIHPDVGEYNYGAENDLRTFRLGRQVMHGVAVDDDDNIYVCGALISGEVDDTCLWKLSSAGAVLWSFAIEMDKTAAFLSPWLKATDVVMCSDGGVALFLTTSESQDGGENSLIYKVSSSGGEQWRSAPSTYNNPFSDHAYYHDTTVDMMGGIYYTSRESSASFPITPTVTSRLTCISESGSVVWAVDHATGGFRGVGYDSKRGVLWVLFKDPDDTPHHHLQSRDPSDGSLIDSNRISVTAATGTKRILVEGAG